MIGMFCLPPYRGIRVKSLLQPFVSATVSLAILLELSPHQPKRAFQHNLAGSCYVV
jgi:hypothetical protein